MSWFGIWVRGLAMGAADAVPGVSGGTVAFLTGIYERWIAVLIAIRPDLWAVFRREGVRGLWLRLDGGFVVPLVVGILMSLITLAHWIKDWLEVFLTGYGGFSWGSFSRWESRCFPTCDPRCDPKTGSCWLLVSLPP